MLCEKQRRVENNIMPYGILTRNAVGPCQLYPIPLHHLRLQFKRGNDRILMSVDQIWVQLERDGCAISGQRHDFHGELNFRANSIAEKHKGLISAGCSLGRFVFRIAYLLFAMDVCFWSCTCDLLNPHTKSAEILK